MERSYGDCGVIYLHVSNHHCLHFEMKYLLNQQPTGHYHMARQRVQMLYYNASQKGFK